LDNISDDVLFHQEAEEDERGELDDQSPRDVHECLIGVEFMDSRRGQRARWWKWKSGNQAFFLFSAIHNINYLKKIAIIAGHRPKICKI